jgi:4-hydroxy-3-polyprenylbenzoate decarboxylase
VKSECFEPGEKQTLESVGPEWINKASDWFFAQRKKSSEDS